MLRPTSIVLLALALVPFVGGCNRVFGTKHVGSGVSAKTTRTLDSFDKIKIHGMSPLHFRTGPAFKVEIEGDENLLPLYGSSVSAGVLNLGFGEGSHDLKVPFRVRVEAPSLVSLDASGSLDAELEGLGGESFTLECSGVAKVHATGEVTNLRFEARGALDAEAYDLKARHVFVDVSGSADVHVTALETIGVDIKGAGTVRYRGTPKITENRIAGAGKIVAE